MHPIKKAVIIKESKTAESSQNRPTTSIQVCRYPICTLTKKRKTIPYKPSLVVKIETGNMSSEFVLPKRKERVEHPKPQPKVERPNPQDKIEQPKLKERHLKLKKIICPDCMDPKVDSTVMDNGKIIPIYIIDDDD